MHNHRLPFVLLPGLLSSPALYAAQIPLLWRYGPVQIADTTQHDNFPDMARHILSTAPDRFILLGMSMGGYLAFELLRQAPQRIARLILIDTTARPDAPETTAVRREQIALAQQGRLADILSAGFAFSVHRSRIQDEALRRAIKDMAQSLGAPCFVRQQQAIMARADSRPLLAGIRCPALVLVGDSDPIAPPEHAREIADGLGDAQLVVLPQCGHVATLERPEEVNQALAAWLPACVQP